MPRTAREILNSPGVEPETLKESLLVRVEHPAHLICHEVRVKKDLQVRNEVGDVSHYGSFADCGSRVNSERL
jgi:hypothetical protein